MLAFEPQLPGSGLGLGDHTGYLNRVRLDHGLRYCAVPRTQILAWMMIVPISSGRG